jgi:hypothetical protein
MLCSRSALLSASGMAVMCAVPVLLLMAADAGQLSICHQYPRVYAKLPVLSSSFVFPGMWRAGLAR